MFVRVSRSDIPSGTAGELQAWIFRIARNLVVDFHRRRARTPVMAAAGLFPPQSASQDVGVAINEALASLPELERDVFLMREVGGLGYAEIAAACDLTHDAVRSRIHRARLQLRRQLAAPVAAHRRHVMPRMTSARSKDRI